MKKPILRTLSVAALALLVAGCSQTPGAVGAEKGRTGVMPGDAAWAAAISPQGRLKIAHYDEKRHLHIVDADKGADSKPYHPEKTERASSGVDLAWVGDEAYVAFRDKLPQRDLFIGNVAKPDALVGVGGETVPLARVKLLPTGKGLVAVWYGEQHIGEKKYHVSYRELDGQGQPVGDVQQLFEGIYPVASLTPSGRFTAVTWQQKGGVNTISARSKKPGEPFGPEVPVATAAPLTPLFEAISSGERTVAFWHAQYGANLDEFRLEGAFSDDGTQWQRFHLKGLDGMDIESADFAADGQGNIAAVVAAVPHADFVAKIGKMQAFIVLSHDNGVTWSAPMALRQDPLQKDKDKAYSHSKAPKVVFTGPGKLLVAWQDWRDLRSAVHISYSEDGGKNWLLSDQRLSEQGGVQEGLALFSKALFTHDGTAQLVLERYTDDSMRDKRLEVRTLKREDLVNWKVRKAKHPQPDPDKLEQRVLEYWTAMQARDFEKSYALLDPYYRSRVRFDIYKQDLGKIEYREPSIKLKTSYGPLALAVTKMTVEVKPVTINNKTFKLDPTEKEIPTRWMWLDGNWYMEYYSEQKGIKYTPF